jgi:hypothetical protein
MKLGLTIGAVVLGAALAQGRAGATWPSGAVVTFPGYACAAPFVFDQYGDRVQYCPYISDSLHAGSDIPQVNVDLSATIVSGHWVEFNVCNQSWTGSAVNCFSPDPNVTQTTYTSGYSELWQDEISWYFSASEMTSPWDYYYVAVYWQDATDTEITGYSFVPQSP